MTLRQARMVEWMPGELTRHNQQDLEVQAMTSITEKHDTAKPTDSTNSKANAGITSTGPVFSQKGNTVESAKDVTKDAAGKEPGNMQGKAADSTKA